MIPTYLRKKIIAFEYLSSKFFEWYLELNPTNENLLEIEFNKPKLIKLHFFACAAVAKHGGGDLFDLFNNFHALHPGHVESDVYAYLNELETIQFLDHTISIRKSTYDYKNELGFALIQELDKAVNVLRDRNKYLVEYGAIELVKLSQTWHSWRSVFGIARSIDRYSMKIPNALIRAERKSYVPDYSHACF